MRTFRAFALAAGIATLSAGGTGASVASLEPVFSDGFESGGVSAWSSFATAAVPDPDLDGPYTSTSFQTTITVAATGSVFGATVWYPTAGPLEPPYPLAVIGHGFQLPPGQYADYAGRLASFGYVAVTPDYPTPLLAPDHRGNALDLMGVVDWAVSAPQLAGLVDVDRVAMLGHSLGGKAAVLAALLDDRVAVVVGLDPVDSSPAGCDPDDCPDVSVLAGGLAIPSLLLGETLDAQACAPAADNYTTFYAATPPPSLEVTVLGASHMSFLDDVSSCGLPCLFCQTATVPDATVNALARAFAAAFLERWLRGRVAYDSFLTGAEAQSRYVVPGLAILRWR